MMKRTLAIFCCLMLLMVSLSGCKKPREENAAADTFVETPETEKVPQDLPSDKPADAGKTEGEQKPSAEQPKEEIAQESKVRLLQEPLYFRENHKFEEVRGAQNFLVQSIKTFLSNAGQENAAYSPGNMYLALGMLAEITDGDSRQQILNALGARNIETLRKTCLAYWESTYRDGESAQRLLASSLWLDEDIAYDEDTLEVLADYYFASSYQGKMGDPAYEAALKKWLNEQTGGLLQEQVGGLRMDPEAVITLATTFYYKGSWFQKFDESKTAPATFHGAAGDTTCDFMYISESNDIYEGAQFIAAERNLGGSGAMHFILPNEGTTPEALLGQEEFTKYLKGAASKSNYQYRKINYGVPKFDIETNAAKMKAEEKLKQMGVTAVFSSDKADFSRLGKNLEGSRLAVDHAARIMIDEEGCTAASFVKQDVLKYDSLKEPQEFNFILDRPFIVVITDPYDLPLFAGIVNQV